MVVNGFAFFAGILIGEILFPSTLLKQLIWIVGVWAFIYIYWGLNYREEIHG